MRTTSLQKRREIPNDVKTRPEDVALSLEELVAKFKGKRVAMLMYDSGTDISVLACERLYDIPFYAARERILPSIAGEHNTVMLLVNVMDPEDLPYDVECDEEVFVIYDGWDFSQHFDMDSATESIEQLINQYHGDIEDFVVLIGKEMNHRVIRNILNRTQEEVSNQ